jgi:hypothetical protein
MTKKILLPNERTTLITHMLSSLEAPYKELSKWEEDFLVSVTDQWETRQSLSDKQVEILERIYAEKTE